LIAIAPHIKQKPSGAASPTDGEPVSPRQVKFSEPSGDVEEIPIRYTHEATSQPTRSSDDIRQPLLAGDKQRVANGSINETVSEDQQNEVCCASCTIL